jgi:hypothetical protein
LKKTNPIKTNPMWNTKTQIIYKIQYGIQNTYIWFVFLYSTLDFIDDLCFCISHWIVFMICVFVFHIGFYLWFVFLYSILDFIYDLCFCIPHWILFMICVFVFHIGFYLWFVFLYSIIKFNVEYKNTNHI